MTPKTCPVCDERFASIGTLREHAREVHGACHYCGERIEGAETLHLHWLDAHGDELSRIDRERAAADVGSMTLRDRFERGGAGAALRSVPRRTVIGGVVTVLAGAAALAFGVDRQSGESAAMAGDPTTRPGTGDGPVASGPVPGDPGEFRYPVIGGADADLTVTYFGNWKCPYCARFSEGFLGTLVEDYVEPGDVAIQYRNLAYVGGRPFLGPDAPDAGRAGLAVWDVDPAAYWSYHETVFQNQPPESERWATADRLESFARQAGVSDPGAVRSAVERDGYEADLRATTTAAERAGVDGTPALVIDGAVVSPFDREATRRRIEDALE